MEKLNSLRKQRGNGLSHGTTNNFADARRVLPLPNSSGFYIYNHQYFL